MRILVLHGPNLDLLGTREPGLYGSTTLAEIDAGLVALGAALGVDVTCFQSAHEGALVERVHAEWRSGVSGAIVNAGAYTHTSVALRDALLGTSLRFVEVHISNTAAREPFRHKSLLADVAIGVVQGLGPQGYGLALRGLVSILQGP